MTRLSPIIINLK